MVTKYDVGALEIINIEGIGPKYEEILKKEKIETTGDLLRKADTQEKRLNLSNKTGINLKLITKWTSYADLIRVKGIGEEYSEYLNLLGVETVQDLAEQTPKELHERSEKYDVSKTHAVRKKPTLRQIQGWVRDAKKLPAILKEELNTELDPEIETIETKQPYEFIDPYVENTPRTPRVLIRRKRYSLINDPLLPTTLIVGVITLLIGLTYLLI